MRETFGSGIQHLAFAARDTFATTEALRSSGFATLPIPANYYDDLRARLGLAPDMVARLHAANVLYDRDNHGEFLQLFSAPFADGFFFEVVERRGQVGAHERP